MSAKSNASTASLPSTPGKRDADYVFYELTRSICPECRRVVDAQILLRDNKVYMRKRCPEHGHFEALIYGDAQTYTSSARFNKPGTIPLKYTTEVKHGCPHDCGLCPDHQQHACLGIIERVGTRREESPPRDVRMRGELVERRDEVLGCWRPNPGRRGGTP